MEEKLLSKINYGKLELKNRMIFAPTTLGLSKKKSLAFMEKIAKGGVAMVIIGDVPVGKSRFLPSLFSKRGFKYYEELANICHRYNCLISAELHQDDSNFKALFKYLPKLIVGKVKKENLKEIMTIESSKYISKLKEKKVRSITNSFGKATLQAKKAGFDLVEVHGDRMCGSFTSSLLNKRNDIYGGSLANRFRFAKEAVEAIRKVDKEIPIDFKLVIHIDEYNYGKAGVAVNEVESFVRTLEDAGVTSFHVSLANHSNLSDTIPAFNHPYFKGEGCFLPLVKLVKDVTNLPVCAVGGFNRSEFMNECLEKNLCDTIAMSRELICDPEFPNKVKEGKTPRRCLRCNKGCLGGLMQHRGVSCILNGGKNNENCDSL